MDDDSTVVSASSSTAAAAAAASSHRNRTNNHTTSTWIAEPSLVHISGRDGSEGDSQWWRIYVDSMVRTWKPSSSYDWCIPEMEPTPIRLRSGEQALGLIYMKSYKASSSTLEGITLSIAHHVAKRRYGTNSTPCIHYHRHEFGNNRDHARRGQPSLLFSFVRDPARRDLSHYFHFKVGRKHVEPTSTDIIRHIEYRIKGRQTRYLITKKGREMIWPKSELKRNVTKVIDWMENKLLQVYDFLGIVERMNESLAAMVLLWGIQPTDVIVLSSKLSGGYDDGGENNTCTKIPKSFTTPEIDKYFDSVFQEYNSDILLYQIVNRSLDLTIDMLGRDKVHRLAQEIGGLQRLAITHCQHIAQFPCSPEGVFQPSAAAKSCYVQDAGCGYQCVDQIMEQYRQGKLQLPGS